MNLKPHPLLAMGYRALKLKGRHIPFPFYLVCLGNFTVFSHNKDPLLTCTGSYLLVLVMMRGLQLVLLLVTCSLSVEMCEGAIEYGVKPLPLDEQGQCPSLQERERMIAEISAEMREILSGAVSSCNGSPGWRRVGFVNMTDPSQDCPPGLNLTSHSIRSCGSSHHTP